MRIPFLALVLLLGTLAPPATSEPDRPAWLDLDLARTHLGQAADLVLAQGPVARLAVPPGGAAVVADPAAGTLRLAPAARLPADGQEAGCVVAGQDTGALVQPVGALVCLPAWHAWGISTIELACLGLRYSCFATGLNLPPGGAAHLSLFFLACRAPGGSLAGVPLEVPNAPGECHLYLFGPHLPAAWKNWAGNVISADPAGAAAARVRA